MHYLGYNPLEQRFSTGVPRNLRVPQKVTRDSTKYFKYTQFYKQFFMRTLLSLCVRIEEESDLCGTYPSAHGEESGLQIGWSQVDWEYYVDYSMWLN